MLTVSLASHLIPNNSTCSVNGILAIKQVKDSYLFGAPLEGRTWNSSAYRYTGINGQEADTELGVGVSSATFWEYDAKLGRRWNLDPKPTPFFSSYSCFGNNPIVMTDVAGDTIKVNNRISSNPDAMKAYNLWLESPSGKEITAMYGIGGKYEDVLYEVDDLSTAAKNDLKKEGVTGGLGAEGYTWAYKINTVTGAKTLMQPKEGDGKGKSDYKLEENERLAFKVNIWFDTYNKFTYTEQKAEWDHLTNAIDFAHESQHVRIIHAELIKNNAWVTSSDASHAEMLGNMKYNRERFMILSQNMNAVRRAYKIFYGADFRPMSLVDFMWQTVNKGVGEITEF